VIKMAKPIRATPTLSGDDAVRFMRQMAKEEKRPSKERSRTILNAQRVFPYFRKILASA
jgi:hypothetical protein